MQFSDLMKRTGLIAAHRGNRSGAPENTMAAFRESIGCSDFIELDVQLSRDGVPVVVHDEMLGRTTDIAMRAEFAAYKPWHVCDLTLSQLKSLDAAGWFYRDDPFGTVHRKEIPKRYTSEKIPTLAEVLYFASMHDIFLNIEIKDLSGCFSAAEVVDAVTGLIEREGCAGRVLISSFNHDYLRLAKKKAPQMPAAALQEGAHPDHLADYLGELGTEGYHCDDAIADEATVRQLGEAGIFVGIYTVNDPKRQRELFGWGVNAVFTDFPEHGSES